MLLKFYFYIATVFGIGLLPVIPGTIASIISIFLLFAIYFLFPKWIIWLLLILLIAIGVFVCEQVSIAMKIHDHKCIVLDEFIGMWLIIIVINKLEWEMLILEFLFFRFFDIIKPWPISWVDRNIYGGIGIILDDIIAAICTIFILFYII